MINVPNLSTNHPPPSGLQPIATAAQAALLGMAWRVAGSSHDTYAAQTARAVIRSAIIGEDKPC